MKITVRLNGTDVNPWHRMGLRQNPFPQVAAAEFDRPMRHLAALGGDPVPDTAYIRKHLKGWSPEFVELCCRHFVKGKDVAFDVQFDRAK